IVSANRRIYTTGVKVGALNDAVDDLGRELLLDHLKKFGEDNSLHGLIALCSAEPTSAPHDRSRDKRDPATPNGQNATEPVGRASNQSKSRRRGRSIVFALTLQSRQYLTRLSTVLVAWNAAVTDRPHQRLKPSSFSPSGESLAVWELCFSHSRGSPG